MPTPVMMMKQPQERLKIPRTLAFSYQEQTAPRPQIHGTEDHTPGVLATNQDFPRLAPQRPTGSQRRKQKKVRFVFCQQHAPGPQLSDFPANPSFFSPTPGQQPGGIDPVSRHNRAGV